MLINSFYNDLTVDDVLKIEAIEIFFASNIHFRFTHSSSKI